MKRRGNVGSRLPPFDQQRRKILFGIGISDIGRIKPNPASRIAFEKLAHAAPQDGANQDVGIQDNHLSERRPFRDYAPV